uniref:Uncharacterized protein n=1 Tax=Romanomermis culicivorax TaxID=13658 RepID=A0A915JQY6_ROMCU
MLDWLNPDYIRRMVEINKRTMNDISELLKLEYPDKIGLSLRNLKEFCKRHNIHKRMPLSSEELNYHVATAVCEKCNCIFICSVLGKL